MKKNLLLAGLLLSSSSLFAEVKPFVGIDFSKADADYSEKYAVTGGSLTGYGVTLNSGDSETFNGNSSDSQPSFKAGVIVDNTHRMYLRYGAYDGDNDSEMKLTTVHYDYLFDIKNEYKITPYVGAFAGQGKLETLAGNGSGAVYGANVGMIIPITDNLEFDTSFAYLDSNVSAKESISGVTANYDGITLTNFSANSEVELKNASIINFGFNYKF